MKWHVDCIHVIVVSMINHGNTVTAAQRGDIVANSAIGETRRTGDAEDGTTRTIVISAQGLEKRPNKLS